MPWSIILLLDLFVSLLYNFHVRIYDYDFGVIYMFFFLGGVYCYL